MAQRIGLPVSGVKEQSLEVLRNMECVVVVSCSDAHIFLSNINKNLRPLVLSQAPVCTDGLSDSTDV